MSKGRLCMNQPASRILNYCYKSFEPCQSQEVYTKKPADERSGSLTPAGQTPGKNQERTSDIRRS